jgi:acyl-CoA synthetase (AMP-forming)/AMP-acid ligase II
MAAYKYPRIVEFVDEIPMTSTGKPLKCDWQATRWQRCGRPGTEWVR